MQQLEEYQLFHLQVNEIIDQLNSIDTLISQALIDIDISHEEFITILKEKDRYEMMKDNLRNKNGESYEIMRFNSVKSKI